MVAYWENCHWTNPLSRHKRSCTPLCEQVGEIPRVSSLSSSASCVSVARSLGHVELETTALVSVLMPVYNAERHLREAVDSILSQTFANFEFIIVDDGSADATGAILDEYSDSRIVRVRHETNRGMIAALNSG